MKRDLLATAAVKHDVAQPLVELHERCLNVETVVFRETLDHLVVIRCLAVPATNRTAGQRQVLVDDYALRIEVLFDAEAVASRACAAWIIERE